MTEEELAALKLVADFRNPVYSPRPGSNLWPLLIIRWRGKTHNGDTLDKLVRLGLLSAKPLKEEQFVHRHRKPEEYPDLYVTHRLRLTMKGRKALRDGTAIEETA
jgi:hypothetical protein